jgi:hypothetical protein
MNVSESNLVAVLISVPPYAQVEVVPAVLRVQPAPVPVVLSRSSVSFATLLLLKASHVVAVLVKPTVA